MNLLRKLLGLSDEEVVRKVNGEPTIKNARKALARADSILVEYQLAEDDRLDRQRLATPRTRT